MLVLLGLLCCTSPVRATPDEADPSEAAAREGIGSVPPDEVSSPARDHSAVVVLVGPAGESEALSELIEELLADVAITPRFSRVAGMKRAELLDQAAQPSSGRARVWVILSGPDLALLLFAGPSGDRYLVRQVPLRSGLDELGRERIAQVLQSSLLMLLRGDTGLTRAEMRVAVQKTEDAAPIGPPSHGAMRGPPRAEPPRRQAPAARPLAAPRLGLGYAAAWTGPAMGARHGPALQVGLDAIGGTVLHMSVTLERDFDQTHDAAEVGVRTQTTSVRFLLGGQWRLGGSTGWYARAGAGLDATRVAPTQVRESAVRLRNGLTDVTAVTRAEAGVTLDCGPFVVDLGPRLDVSPHDTHYDLADEGQDRRVVTPWPAVPGVQVSGAWHPWGSRKPGATDFRAGSGSTLASRDTDSP